MNLFFYIFIVFFTAKIIILNELHRLPDLRVIRLINKQNNPYNCFSLNEYCSKDILDILIKIDNNLFFK